MKTVKAKINSAEMATTTTGKTFLKGVLTAENEKGSKEFKIWAEAHPEDFMDLFANEEKHFEVDYEESSFNGQTYYTIKRYSPLSDEEVYEIWLKKDDEFKKSVVKKLTKDILAPRLSQRGNAFIKDFFGGNKALWERFTVEQAAVKMHDAKPSGLINHTTKMLEILALIMDQHENFNLNEEGQDLIFIGMLLHDIGKVLEYNNGEVTKLAKVTHRGLGIEIVVENKELFLKHYPEDFYYEVIAIINQHHGVFEERPHSVFSYLVHLVDMHDTHVSALHENILSHHDSETVRVIDRDIPPLVKENHYFNFEDEVKE